MAWVTRWRLKTPTQAGKAQPTHISTQFKAPGPRGMVGPQGPSANTIEVRNETGATIPRGTLVHTVGATGTHQLVAIADPTTTQTVSGMAWEAIEHNATGLIQTLNEFGDLDTDGLTAGAVLYLGSGGAFSEAKPEAGAVIRIGKVGLVHPSQGSVILALPQDAREADEVAYGGGTVAGALDGIRDTTMRAQAIGPPEHVIMWDDFDRPVGSDLGDAPTGQTWEQVSGAWEIIEDSRGARYLAGPGYDNTRIAVVDLGTPNARLTSRAGGADPSTSREGHAFCVVDADNYIYVADVGPGPRVGYVLGGSNTLLLEVNYPDGDNIGVFRVSRQPRPTFRLTSEVLVNTQDDAIIIGYTVEIGGRTETGYAQITDSAAFAYFADKTKHGFKHTRAMRFYDIIAEHSEIGP